MADAPGIPDGPKKEEPKKIGPRRVTSLTEIVEAATKSPPRPDPVLLEWILPPSPDEPLGLLMQLEIKTRYPEDAWLFGIKYMTDVQDLKKKQEPDPKGVLQNVHPDADFLAVAREVVVEPTWLHNEAAIAKFKANVPTPTFSELRMRLMLIAGLNADFFAGYQEMTVPRAWLLPVSASPSASASPPGASTPKEPTNSSPGSSSTDSAVPKTGESASETNSGSSPSTPTTVPAA